jgi:hypothetical protein
MEKAGMIDLDDPGLRPPNEPNQRPAINDPGRWTAISGDTHPRAVGSPLPIGGGSPPSLLGVPSDSQQPNVAPPPLGRGLANSNPSTTLGDNSSSLQWFANALRSALPFVHKLLPMLDGNFGTAVANVLAPHPQPQPPPPPVNLEPLEDGLAALQTQHRDLRNQIVEQNTSLKRVEDQLEMVREATDRNTLEQQELLEDLKSVGTKFTRFAFFVLALLAISIVVNVILYLHIRRVLP